MAARLTEDAVKSVVIPGTGSKTYWDDQIPGFGLRVHNTGGKSFFLNYRVNGREKRIAIGKYPAWTAAQARIEAKKLRQNIDKEGRDPAGDRRERREAPTVQDLVDRYITEHLPSKFNKNGARHNDEKRMLGEIASTSVRTPVSPTSTVVTSKPCTAPSPSPVGR